jgi:uncharacterized protein (TIGR02444 family)
LPQDVSGPLDYDNEFWRFSLAVHGQAEVAQECLGLQDAHGIDVNILLFCAWLGMQAVALQREDIEAVSQAVANWHDDIVRPLRAVRQRLKDFSGHQKLRAGIKDGEIEAEQIEQAMLFAFSRQLQRRNAGQGDCIASNVRQYIAMKAPTADAHATAMHLVDAARRAG